MTANCDGVLPNQISDRADLIAYLQCAVELEHATLPLYLCALYSLDPGRNPVAAEVLTTVFVEEMLHLTLAANLLNAVGGAPELDHPRLLPGFPRALPHGDETFEVSLLPFGPEALAQLARLERPAEPGSPAQAEGYSTIGQFYTAIRLGLCDLEADIGESALFCGDPARQVTDSFSYGGSGRIICVDDHASAQAALREIVEQGEGGSAAVWDGDRDMFHPERDEVGHFYRIEELCRGRRFRRGNTPGSGPTGDAIAIDWDGVRPSDRNRRRRGHADTRTAQRAFDVTYCDLLAILADTFNGRPERLDVAVGTMYQLKSSAQALMEIPSMNGWSATMPTFEYVSPADRFGSGARAGHALRR